jgi:ankyrin repeat protein
MIAAAEGNVDTFKVLLHAGADVINLKNKYGLTAFNLIDLNQNDENK